MTERSVPPVLQDDRDRVERSVRLAIVGVSAGQTCGVRDHAILLANALDRANMSCSAHWFGRSEGSMRGARAEIQKWTRRLAAELDANKPDAILLHYSVFAYSYGGIPLFVHPLLSALRSSRVPIVTVLHEYAYPWKRSGWRGTLWALTQRAILIEVMRASTAVSMTTDFRADWIDSRAWLPRRPVRFAPVFSNLPPPAAGARPDRDCSLIGLFGYSAEGAAVSMTLDAMRLLEDRGAAAHLRLLGAPGPQSAAGAMWLSGARTRQIAHRLSFSGIVAPAELANGLAACDALLFAETDGPTSRKTTLAASLASGRPVLAIDGPRRWPELAQAQAAQIVQPTSQALAGAIQSVLADERLRETLGARGRAFAQDRMSAARAAGVVIELLEDCAGSGSRRSAQAMPYIRPRADCHVERAVR